MRRLFGTDGVRGVANRDLTPELALVLGRAAGAVLAADGGRVVVGRDTRVSGPMLEAALVAGLCSVGAHVAEAGIVPTPAVAFLTREERAAAGAVISASHNPIADNGIKFFSEDGAKITQQMEEEIERLAASEMSDLPVGTRVGTVETMDEAHDRYVGHLLGSIDQRLDGLRVVLDCAFGAAWKVGPRAFREAGADVTALHAEPDGARINVDCGSTSLGRLAATVASEGADLGLAFDGDADRVLAVDETGAPVDGDQILGVTALYLKHTDALHNDIVVGTVMSNLGLRRALEEHGIDLVAVQVGDRFVSEEMRARGAVVGGEQSGHVIFADHASTGDGILTGLHLAESLMAANEPLSKLSRFFEPYPQVLLNVEVEDPSALEESEAVRREIAAAEAALGRDGRVLVRPSGTESVVRVMVEAADDATARRTAEHLAEQVRTHLTR